MFHKKSLSIVLLSLFLFSGCGQSENYVTEKTARRDLTQTVSVTGTVQADPRIELQFQKNGTIAQVFKKEGDFVKQDDILAKLNNEDLDIQVKAAAANLASAEARLDQELAGAKSQDIRLADLNITQAKTDLKSTQTALINTKNINQQQILNAQIAITQAEINLAKAENDLKYTNEIIQQNVHAAELDLAQAENNLANSTQSTENSKDTADQNLANAYQDIIPKLDDAFLTVAKNLTAVDNILGLNSTSLVPNSINLAAKNPNSLDLAKAAYKQAKGTYDLTKPKYDAWLLTKDRATLDLMVISLINNLYLAKIALDDTYIVLTNSITSGQTGLNSDLKTFTDLIANEITSNTASSKNLQDAMQAIWDAGLNQKNSTNTAKSSQDSAQNQYDQAVKNLATAQINATNDLKKAELAVATKNQELNQSQQNFTQTKASTKKQEDDLTAQISFKEVALKNAQTQFDKVTASPRSVDIRGFMANVDKANADLEGAKYNYDQSLLKAPIDGQVVDFKKDVGENITANEVFAVVDTAQLLIKANVAETDIGKIDLKDEVNLTFDAFDFSDHFTGQVVAVAPSETVVEGVIYYEVKISFEAKPGKAVRPGLTANLEIITAKKTNILSVPARSVKYEGDTASVQILKDAKLETRPIKTGLEGDQYVEVLSGVEEGEEVVTYIKE